MHSVLEKYKNLLDLSSIQLDVTQTPSKRGGEATDYQGRRHCITSNLLLIVDNHGTQLSYSEPIAGNHNDAHNLVDTVDKMFDDIHSANITTDGLFLNADAGFDIDDF